MDECVANFIKELDWARTVPKLNLQDMDIKVSMITAPNNRNDLKGIRDDLIENRKL